MTDYRWHVAQALAGRESTAVYHLSRSGITAFQPIADRTRLFPGYVFVELANAGEEAGIVNRTIGIRKLLPVHAEAPLALPRGFVEELRDRIGRKEFDERSAEEIVAKFVPQQEVFIKTGPFRDHRGRFLRYRKGAGIVILCLLGKEHELPIPARELAPVPDFTTGRTRGAPSTVAVAA